MSVTFSIPEAPVKQIEEECLCEGRDPNCRWCQGTGQMMTPVSTAPELTLCNVNARAILTVLGLQNEYLNGHLEVSEISKVRQKILAASNSPRKRASAIREDYTTSNFIEFGYTDDQILARLQRLDFILGYGQEHNQSVSWG